MATASGICKHRSTDRPRGDDDDVVKEMAMNKRGAFVQQCSAMHIMIKYGNIYSKHHPYHRYLSGGEYDVDVRRLRYFILVFIDIYGESKIS